MKLTQICLGLALAGSLLGNSRPAQAAQDFVYVHDRGQPNQVYGYQLSTTGALTAVPGSPFLTSAGPTNAFSFCRGNCQTAAYSSKLKVLYVTGSAGVSALQVGADGTLTEVTGSPFGPTGEYIGVTVFQKGKSVFVYAAEVFSGRLRGFRAAADGALTELPGSPYSSGNTPVAINAAKGKLFAIAQNGAAVNSYKIEKNGSLTRTADTTLPAAGSYTLYLDPKGKTVSVPSNLGAGGVAVFKVTKTGALANTTGSPFLSDVSTTSGLAFGTPFLFGMSNTGATDLQVFKRAASGKLTRLRTQSSGFTGFRSGAVLKTRLVLASDDGNAVRTYSIAKDGTLTVLDTETADLEYVNQVLILRR